MQNTNDIAEAIASAKITLIANSIRHVNPKIVTITRSHQDMKHPFTIIDVPIEPELYEKLLQVQAASSQRYATWLPFIFLINEQNRAFDLMPHEVFNAQQEATHAKTLEIKEIGEINEATNNS